MLRSRNPSTFLSSWARSARLAWMEQQPPWTSHAPGTPWGMIHRLMDVLLVGSFGFPSPGFAPPPLLCSITVVSGSLGYSRIGHMSAETAMLLVFFLEILPACDVSHSSAVLYPSLGVPESAVPDLLFQTSLLTSLGVCPFFGLEACGWCCHISRVSRDFNALGACALPLGCFSHVCAF